MNKFEHVGGGVPCTVRSKLNKSELNNFEHVCREGWVGARVMYRDFPAPGGQTDKTEKITFATPLAGRTNYEHINCW